MREKRKSEKHYKSIELQEEEDGRKLLWLDVTGLDDNIYTQSCIIHDGTRYSSVPSAIVSLLAVKKYLREN